MFTSICGPIFDYVPQLKRCAKLSQSHQEVLLISGKTINDLIAQVKHDLGGLYHCAEAVIAAYNLSGPDVFI